MTIPDLIDFIGYKWKVFWDYPFRWMESIGSWMNVYAWNKRWKNRQKGTGYAKESYRERFKNF